MAGAGDEQDTIVTRTCEGEADEANAEPALTSSLASQPASWEAPSRAGRYIVGERIGAGGMGVVYQARDPNLNRKVAIKFLHPERDAGSGGASRLLREAQAMAQLSHPNVVTIHDVGTVDGQIFIAMAFIDGVTLREWLAAAPRSWSEIWRVFRDAGRGLAAAHEAGIVHRDFKPDNVLIDGKGRALVTDFGLARLAAGGPLTQSGDDTTDLVKPITVTGSIMGTPRYMAPEQHEGQEADARSDQFSYCVALYEAMYGAAPFAGETHAALAAAVRSGELSPEPAGNDVPRWRRELVLRGLSVEPAERHDGMAALVNALDRDPRARRRRLVAAVVAVAVLTGGGAVAGTMMASREGATGAACDAQSDPFAGIWDDARKAEIRAQFDALPRPLGQDVHRRFTEAVDRYVGQWRARAKRNCQATKVDKTQSAELFDLRAQCLDRRRYELEALTRIYAAETRASALVDAFTVIAQLTPLRVCEDDKALRAAYPLPEDPGERAKVLALQKDSSEVAATFMAGRNERARAMAEALLLKEKPVGFVPVRAEAEYHIALTELDKGGAGVEARLKRVIKLFAQARLDTRLAEAWLDLFDLVGRERKRFEEAKMMRPAVEAAVARSSDATVDGVYHQRWARVLYVNGQIEQAQATSKKGIEILVRALGEDHLRVAFARNDHAMYLRFAGKPDEALAQSREALRVVEEKNGANHPSLAAILNMIAVLTRDNDPRASLSMLLRALKILRGSGGREGGFDEAALENSVGNGYVRVDELDKAEASYRRALSIFEKIGGPDSREARVVRMSLAKALCLRQDLDGASKHARFVAASFRRGKVSRLDKNRLANYLWSGRIAHARGEHRVALEHFRTALEILRAINPAHPASILYQTWIARTLADSGDASGALRQVERALRARMASRAFRASDIPALTLLGRLLLDRGQRARGLERLETAAKLMTEARPTEQKAELQATLARAIVETGGDRQRALGLLKQALPYYRSRTTPTYARDRDRLLAWMSKRKLVVP